MIEVMHFLENRKCLIVFFSIPNSENFVALAGSSRSTGGTSEP